MDGLVEAKGHAALEFVRVDPSQEARLAALFREIRASNDHLHFHPHAFDDQTARWIANYDGHDLYVLAREPRENRFVGYGMLRGWDAGFNVPSLGILIVEGARGKGFGKELMLYLHSAARARHCSKVRLKVYPNNAAAVQLYKDLGYVFCDEEDGQLVGVVEL
jgi:ribosomal-protein-alanine N-acetyltransferase